MLACYILYLLLGLQVNICLFVAASKDREKADASSQLKCGKIFAESRLYNIKTGVFEWIDLLIYLLYQAQAKASNWDFGRAAGCLA